jgi:hypothetical protein
MKLSREAFGFALDTVLGERKHITSDDLRRVVEIVERIQAEAKPPPRRPSKSARANQSAN